jgi:hypothetical protein
MIFKKNIKKISNDAFISRLRCSVIGEGMLHDGNIYLMDYAIKNMPENGFVMEIGCYGGLSTNLILHLLSKNNKKQQLIGCDAWIYEGYKDHTGIIEKHIDGRKDIDRKKYMEHIKKSFIRSTQFLHPDTLPYTCHCTSDVFFEKWNENESFEDVFHRKISLDKPISFCYIDGDHSYEQTKKDFENIDSKLLVDGFVLIDDSAKGMNFGSAKFIKDLLKKKNYKFIDSNPNYLFQKIK